MDVITCLLIHVNKNVPAIMNTSQRIIDINTYTADTPWYIYIDICGVVQIIGLNWHTYKLWPPINKVSIGLGFHLNKLKISHKHEKEVIWLMKQILRKHW